MLTAFLTGRIIWVGEMKTSRAGKPWRNVLVKEADTDQVVSVMIFDETAPRWEKGDTLAAEGRLSAEIWTNKIGEIEPSLTIMANHLAPGARTAARFRKLDKAAKRQPPTGQQK